MTRKQSCDEHVHRVIGCEGCLLRKRLYNKRRAALLLRQRRQSAPVSIARDRLRQLRALGYSVNDLSVATGLAPASVWRLSSEMQTVRVQLRTHRAVEKAWLELREYPAVSDGRAARSAARNGWTPPVVEPLPPVIDMVAIRRALRGERIRLSPEERAEAVREGIRHGLLPYQIATVLHMSNERVKGYLAGGEPKRRGGKKKAA